MASPLALSKIDPKYLPWVLLAFVLSGSGVVGFGALTGPVTDPVIVERVGQIQRDINELSETVGALEGVVTELRVSVATFKNESDRIEKVADKLEALLK